jgi:hypothetical protein
MPDAFSSPAAQVKITDYNGALLLVTPTAYETGITTTFNPDKDAVRADFVVLDGPEAGTEHSDALIFPGVLIGQLKARVGKGMVLGRMGQLPASKAGMSPAWKLMDPTDTDKDVARAHLAKVDPFGSPA